MAARAIPRAALVVAAPDVLSGDFGAEQVLLDLKDGVYYGLEDVGARIWQLVRRPVTVESLRDTLVEEYDVEPERCERDLRALLGELRSRGLIEVFEP